MQHTTRKHRALAAGVLVLLVPTGMGLAGPSDLEKIFARGVYYGLDPNALRVNAEAVGKDIPAFLDQLFRDLRQTYHCNLFWSNSGAMEHYAQAMPIAARHGLKIVGWYNRYQTSPMGTEAAMEALARQTTEALQTQPACGGYVICEETGAPAMMDYYRQLIERYDPSPARPPIALPMPFQSPRYFYQTGFRIICPDVYFFGSPLVRANANTPESSRACYTQVMNGLGDMARRTGKTVWVIAQAQCIIDGKRWDDDQGHHIAEPGSGWGLRMPTPAEMRFQIWDAVRAGCRGVIFFYLMPYEPAWRPDKPNLTEAERKWGERMDQIVAANRGQTQLLTQRTNTGDAQNLLKRGGGATRQSRAVAEAFAAIEKLEPLLVSWRRAAFPAVFGDHPAGLETFESPDRPGRRFAVVVNYNTAAKQALSLLFAPNVTAVTDLRSGAGIPLSPAPDPDGLLSAAVTLEAGDGTVLELAFAGDRPGILLFEEDFSRFHSSILLENTERINLPRLCGVGDYWGVRKVRAPAPDGTARATGMVVGRQEGPVPCARLPRLQEVPERDGPLGGSLALVDKGLCDVFLAVEGTFPKMESLVIATVTRDGQEAWLRSDGHCHPVRIPARDAAGKEIVEIRFLLADDALLTNVRCWRVERPK